MKKKTNNENSLKDFIDALDEIQKTKGIDKEELISAVEAALISAYKKDYKGGQNVKVEIDRETGEMGVYSLRTVAETVENAMDEISLREAQEINPNYQIDDVVETRLNPKDFGRVAAQNAKQLILQRIKEAERNMVFDLYLEKKDELITGVVQRTEKTDVYVNIGKAEGVMNYMNQIPGEHYYSGMRVRVYINDVVRTTKGPQILLSRSNPAFIKRLFELEIPEVYDGTVEIHSISREAGSRTKIAVSSRQEDIDAVGACVGHKGTRIQNILNEIGEERIDVVEYSEDPVQYIKNALNPAATLFVETSEDGKAALVVVDDSQLSLAIGKDGQNVRLAAKLTGWKIDIKNEEQYQQLIQERETESDDTEAEIFEGEDDELREQPGDLSEQPLPEEEIAEESETETIETEATEEPEETDPVIAEAEESQEQ